MMRKIIAKRCNFYITLVVCILVFHVTNGFPTSTTEKSIESEEQHFPNGTVIGKYAYVDKEGNPVQIRYYADDSSYGVELNSLKVVSDHQEGSISPLHEKQAKKLDKMAPNIPAKEYQPEALPKGGSFEYVDAFKYAEPSANNKNQVKPDYLDLLHKEEIHQKSKYKNPDYEVYAKNDVDNPTQCGNNNEKVRVYNFVKEARKARDVPEEEDQPEEEPFCDL